MNAKQTNDMKKGSEANTALYRTNLNGIMDNKHVEKKECGVHLCNE